MSLHRWQHPVEHEPHPPTSGHAAKAAKPKVEAAAAKKKVAKSAAIAPKQAAKSPATTPRKIEATAAKKVAKSAATTPRQVEAAAAKKKPAKSAPAAPKQSEAAAAKKMAAKKTIEPVAGSVAESFGACLDGAVSLPPAGSGAVTPVLEEFVSVTPPEPAAGTGSLGGSGAASSVVEDTGPPTPDPAAGTGSVGGSDAGIGEPDGAKLGASAATQAQRAVATAAAAVEAVTSGSGWTQPEASLGPSVTTVVSTASADEEGDACDTNDRVDDLLAKFQDLMEVAKNATGDNAGSRRIANKAGSTISSALGPSMGTTSSYKDSTGNTPEPTPPSESRFTSGRRLDSMAVCGMIEKIMRDINNNQNVRDMRRSSEAKSDGYSSDDASEGRKPSKEPQTRRVRVASHRTSKEMVDLGDGGVLAEAQATLEKLQAKEAEISQLVEREEHRQCETRRLGEELQAREMELSKLVEWKREMESAMSQPEQNVAMGAIRDAVEAVACSSSEVMEAAQAAAETLAKNPFFKAPGDSDTDQLRKFLTAHEHELRKLSLTMEALEQKNLNLELRNAELEAQAMEAARAAEVSAALMHLSENAPAKQAASEPVTGWASPVFAQRQTVGGTAPQAAAAGVQAEWRRCVYGPPPSGATPATSTPGRCSPPMGGAASSRDHHTPIRLRSATPGAAAQVAAPGNPQLAAPPFAHGPGIVIAPPAYPARYAVVDARTWSPTPAPRVYVRTPPAAAGNARATFPHRWPEALTPMIAAPMAFPQRFPAGGSVLSACSSNATETGGSGVPTPFATPREPVAAAALVRPPAREAVTAAAAVLPSPREPVTAAAAVLPSPREPVTAAAGLPAEGKEAQSGSAGRTVWLQPRPCREVVPGLPFTTEIRVGPVQRVPSPSRAATPAPQAGGVLRQPSPSPPGTPRSARSAVVHTIAWAANSGHS